ncbi:50S ribosomal protein L4 [Patescibacteria group bacterium]
MKVNLYNQKGQEIGKEELNSSIFGVEMNMDLVHQAVIAQMANSRKVIAHTKDKSEVSGGGRKPWRQKGTGRARHGSNRSPIWRGGGVTFGPTKDRNFSKKINKKMKRKALFIALSSKISDNEMVMIDKLELAEAKTKQMVGIMNDLQNALDKNLRKGTLVVLPAGDEMISRAGKNMLKVKIVRANSLNVVDVLSHKYMLMLKGSEKVIEKTFI